MFKKITVFLLATIIFVVGISPVSASEETSTTDDFGYVIEDGVEKKIRFVTEEEYYTDTSSDFLIIDASESDKYNDYGSLSISPSGLGREITLIIAGAVAGILANEVWVFIGGSAITQSMFAKAVATITGLGFNPWMIVITGIVLITLTSSESKKPTVFNSAGCVWSGPAHAGTWMCPMRV